MRGTRPTGRRCAAENALTEIMSHRILLVDDEPDILEFVKYTLVKEGYEVFTAQNGAEALKAAAQHRPHLILLDMMMPVMDGAQTCRAIREDPQLRTRWSSSSRPWAKRSSSWPASAWGPTTT